MIGQLYSIKYYENVVNPLHSSHAAILSHPGSLYVYTTQDLYDLVMAGYTKGGSMAVQLTSCLTCSD